MIQIYTDGSCKGNPGPGGWAALIVEEDGKNTPFSGAEPRTTNQRMEVKAAIEGLVRTPPGSQVTVYSDSQYLVNTMTKSWKRQANLDLWNSLDRLVARRSVSWEWLKGHAGHQLQEEADQLAREAAGIGGDGASQEAAPGALPPQEKTLSHMDDHGRARMVDISHKAETERVAVARGRVVMEPSTLELIRLGQVAKGDVLAVARVAGVMAAKQTPHLIPMCHPLLLTDIAVDFELSDAESAVEITATVRTTGKTGVEMEALTATAVSALTIYDMCKSADRRMRIEGVRLARKSGGRSGDIVLE